jgi:general secretion pathway protein I
MTCAQSPSPRPARRCSAESPLDHPDSRFSGGFTLIEVLIALAVVAIALLALTRAASVQVGSFDALRERTLAGWVAANVLTDARLTGAMPATGRSDGRLQFAGRDWRWEREVKTTPTPAVRRIDIQVFAGDSRTPSATLTGFAGTALVP